MTVISITYLIETCFLLSKIYDLKIIYLLNALFNWGELVMSKNHKIFIKNSMNGLKIKKLEIINNEHSISIKWK